MHFHFTPMFVGLDPEIGLESIPLSEFNGRRENRKTEPHVVSANGTLNNKPPCTIKAKRRSQRKTSWPGWLPLPFGRALRQPSSALFRSVLFWP